MRSILSAACGAALVAATAAASCAPSQFWVHYTQTPSEMAVSWATTCQADTLVQYGTQPGNLSLTVEGNSTTYSAFFYTSPFLHHAIVQGLPLNSPVYYRVGSTQSGWSDVMNFTSHPGVGGKMSMLFAVVGDLGQTANSVDTMQHMMANPAIQAIVHAGDLSYADDDEPRWDSFQEMTAPYSQSMPWMVSVGNHEVETNFGQSFQAYTARWANIPGVLQGALYYSWNAGPVHWVMLSSYSDYSPTSAQYAWLQQDLASVDRSLTPWVFVVLHAPWYNSNYAHQGEGEQMRQSMEGLVYKAGVDAVFSGHVHAYERNYRSFNMERDPEGPYYITIGDGGNREGLAESWMSPQPVWSAFRQASYGHGELFVANATHAHWSWHQNPDLEPTIADELWIIKGQNADVDAHGLDFHMTSRARFVPGKGPANRDNKA